ncbi:cupin domain-containing protein [Rothia aerolata]|uniref:LuxR family transcriptional regulator n=1 Tax=Rothia aerolata TaxID=1812262 RepID=A0A917IS09_9MICC|nr:cupin domain-containing protein [Rothia aerolata]GGH60958.1 LuxR family transcriptional regulator [Rothia aerolata]
MAGTHEGRVIEFNELFKELEPFETKPQAKKILEADGANLVLLEFATGQTWKEHHSVHPVVVQVLKGAVDFTVRGDTLHLVPGKPIHLTAHLLHELTATEPSTVMVTMLTGELHPEPTVNLPATEH